MFCVFDPFFSVITISLAFRWDKTSSRMRSMQSHNWQDFANSDNDIETKISYLVLQKCSLLP